MFASAGKTLQIHTLERGSLKTISKYIPRSGEAITQTSWCHDNSYIAILQEQGCAQILALRDPDRLSLVHTISSVVDVTALCFKINTKRVIALGTEHGDVILYDTKNRCVSKQMGQLSGAISAMEFCSFSDLAVVCNNLLVVYNIDESDKIVLENPGVCTVLKCLSKIKGLVGIGCDNGMVIVWDIVGRCKVQTYQLHSGAVTGIAASNKDKLIITAGADRKICVIDRLNKECVFKKNIHQPVTALDISSNEQYMAAGLNDGSVNVYQIPDHLKPQVSSRLHLDPVNRISFENGLSLEMLESDSFLEEEHEYHGHLKPSLTTPRPSSVNKSSAELDMNEITALDPDPTDHLLEYHHQEFAGDLGLLSDEADVDVPEEKVKLDLIKMINNHFGRLEEQLADHCGRLQNLVSSELDSLYAVAARWECFKTMELDDIVRYICTIVHGPKSEPKVLSQKSEHADPPPH